MREHEWAMLGLGAGAIAMAGLFVQQQQHQQPWPLHATSAERAATDHAFHQPAKCEAIPLPDGLGPLLGLLHAPLEPHVARMLAQGHHAGVTRRFRRDATPLRALLYTPLADKNRYFFSVQRGDQLWLRCRFDRPGLPPVGAPDGSGIHNTLIVAGDGVGWLRVTPEDAQAQARLLDALRPPAEA